jgi:hypothetical protein
VNRSQADINKNVDMIVARKKEREYFETSPEYGHLAHKMGAEYLAKLLSEVFLSKLLHVVFLNVVAILLFSKLILGGNSSNDWSFSFLSFTGVYHFSIWRSSLGSGFQVSLP